MFFDPQMHLSRGVPLTEVIGGLRAAADRSAASGGPHAGLIACFLRDLGPADAAVTLEALAGHAGELLGVGLDSAEVGYPPGDFASGLRRRPRARAAHRRARRRGRAARVRVAGARPARRGTSRPWHPQRRGPRAAAAAGGRPDPADRLPAVERPAALRRGHRQPPDPPAARGGRARHGQLRRPRLLRRLHRGQLPGARRGARPGPRHPRRPRRELTRRLPGPPGTAG